MYNFILFYNIYVFYIQLISNDIKNPLRKFKNKIIRINLFIKIICFFGALSIRYA